MEWDEKELDPSHPIHPKGVFWIRNSEILAKALIEKPIMFKYPVLVIYKYTI